MQLRLEQWDPELDGKLSEEAMREKLERMGYQVTRYVYPAGTVFPEHSHDVDKIDGVLSGQFLMRMAGESVVLVAGDLLWVPKGMIHSAEVVGDVSVVSLDAIKR